MRFLSKMGIMFAGSRLGLRIFRGILIRLLLEITRTHNPSYFNWSANRTLGRSKLLVIRSSSVRIVKPLFVEYWSLASSCTLSLGLPHSRFRSPSPVSSNADYSQSFTFDFKASTRQIIGCGHNALFIRLD